jgi:uncharacterized protein with beta-barrel porin domain
MSLVVLSYRLTKIKGVLVSVGICALTNATMFFGPVVGAAGLALAVSSAAQAVPGCNANNGDGTIATSTTGVAYLWTAPTACTVNAGTIAMIGNDALTASGALLTHDSLTNNGYIHASLTGTALKGATISGFSNLVNVGSIDNAAGAVIIGDYQNVGTVGGLSGSLNSFAIYGVNNQSTATIGSMSNGGAILGTIVSSIGPNTVQQGIVVGLNNDGLITGTLNNSGLIAASYGGAYGSGNYLVAAGLVNSNYIGAITNSGTISGDSVGILNGDVSAFNGPSTLGSSASIGQLTNSGRITAGSIAIASAGQIGGITNSGLIESWGWAAIAMATTSSIGTLNNTIAGTIFGYGYAGMDLAGTLSNLTNSGYIGSSGYAAIVTEANSTIGTINNQGAIVGGWDSMVLNGTIAALTNSGFIGAAGQGVYGILNRGGIGVLSNSGTIAANVTGIVNVGGTIGGLYNGGIITGGNVGIANVTGSMNSSIGGYGGITSLVNTGSIGGNNDGIYNNALIGTLSNTTLETISPGTISGGQAGLYNQGSIGSFSNSAGAVLIATNVNNATGLINTGYIGTVSNAGLIQGSTGVMNHNGEIGSFDNSGVVTGLGGTAIANVDGSIGVLSNEGLIQTENGYNAIFNDPNSYIGSLTNSGTIISGVTGTINNPYDTAISNLGQIGTLTNSGLISGTIYGDGIQNDASIGVIVNANYGSIVGTISGGGDGISNIGGKFGGTIGVIANDGVITGTNVGVYNSGTIGTLMNTNVISGGSYGVQNDGTIGALGNSGLIGGFDNGIANSGTIGTLVNSGVINAYYDAIGNSGGTIGTLVNGQGGSIHAAFTGIYNDGQIGSLTNSGTISGDSWVGIANDGFWTIAGTIGTLTNSGAITGGSTGIRNNGVINTLSNSGSIIGYDNDGIINTGGEGGPATINSLTNSGVISGNYAGIYTDAYIGTLVNAKGVIVGGNTGIINDSGLITQLTNSGSIAGNAKTGIENEGSATIGTLTNQWGGTIRGGYSGIYNDDNALIGQLSNSGVIVGGSTGIDNEGTIGALSNTGLITGGQYGVYNDNVIGTLYNDGTISGVTISGTLATYGVYNEYSITSLTNDRYGTISGSTAILNWGTIGTLENSGAILGGSTGILNYETIGTLTNSGNSAVIVADYAIDNDGGSIGSLVNSGNIAGRSIGIANYGSIGSVVNSGQITGGTTAIYSDGLITSLTNQGLISGSVVGVYDNYGSSIGTLNNAGTIAGLAGAGIFNEGTIGSLSNSGHITGVTAGLSNFHGKIGGLTNSGTIEGTGTIGDGVYNSGSIVSLTNSGLIQGVSAGVYNHAAAEPTVLANAQPSELSPASAINTLVNSSTGTISGGASGIYNAGLIATVSNAGLITGGGIGLDDKVSGSIVSVVNSGTITGVNFGLVNAGSIGSLTNSGTISDDSKAGIQNSGSLGSMTNSGLVSGAAGFAVTGGSIGSLDNSGTIAGTQSDGVYVAANLGATSNEGVISGLVNGLNVDASGTIATLMNSGLISAPTAINVVEGGSLGAISNSGKVAGNIVNASTDGLSITGGNGAVFGTFTGYSGGLGVGDIGQITNTASNVAFASGNVLLNDNVNLGAGTLSNTATLQVDNPLTIKGGYLQTSSGTLSVGVAGLSNHGELNVSSAAAVDADGRVMLTSLDNFRFAAGENFTLIEAGSATYNVASMSASAAGFSGGYVIDEVAAGGQTDLEVCLTNRVTPNCSGKSPTYSLATTSNAIIANNAVGSYMGSNVALNKLADAVVALGTSPAANRAGNQLLADPHNNAAVLALQPSLDVLNVVTGHADAARLASNGGGSGVSAGEAGPGLATWGEAYGGGAHQSEDGQFSGYSMSSAGIVAGGDAAIADSNVRVGAVFTYTHADLHEHGDRTGDTLSLDSDGGIVYGDFIGERAYLDLLGGVLFDKFDTVRVVSFTNFDGVASATHDGTQYVAKASGGYRMPMGNSGTTLTPLWGVTYSHLNQDAYTETGGNGAALHVDSQDDNSLKGELGLKLEHSFALTHGDLVPELRVLYRHEFDNGAQVQTSSFAVDEAATFTTLDARPIENSGLVSTAVNFLAKDGVAVTLRYTAEAATGYVSQGGSVRVRWAF